ncbi:MAG: hypothetical protein LBI87_08460 [Candidatus Accumulibacter sp.]|jgi:hypothetical protein|nr:hypothetical protein [Accumulibacter sp.]
MSISILFLPIALVILDRAQQAEESGVSPANERVRFPTAFTDAPLLLEALRDFGAQPTRTDAGDILCKVGKSKLRFTRNGPTFFVEIEGAPSVGEARRHLANIDEDYRRCVQSAVYEKVKARAEKQGLVLEDEDVLEDKTILMTLRIR